MLTLAVWLGIYLRDEMTDHDVGILLGLDPTHVERLKHGIRDALRRPIPRRLNGDLYYHPDALSTDEDVDRPNESTITASGLDSMT
jgi:hypothetical protein